MLRRLIGKSSKKGAEETGSATVKVPVENLEEMSRLQSTDPNCLAEDEHPRRSYASETLQLPSYAASIYPSPSEYALIPSEPIKPPATFISEYQGGPPHGQPPKPASVHSASGQSATSTISSSSICLNLTVNIPRYRAASDNPVVRYRHRSAGTSSLHSIRSNSRCGEHGSRRRCWSDHVDFGSRRQFVAEEVGKDDDLDRWSDLSSLTSLTNSLCDGAEFSIHEMGDLRHQRVLEVVAEGTSGSSGRVTTTPMDVRLGEPNTKTAKDVSYCIEENFSRKEDLSGSRLDTMKESATMTSGVFQLDPKKNEPGGWSKRESEVTETLRASRNSTNNTVDRFPTGTTVPPRVPLTFCALRVEQEVFSVPEKKIRDGKWVQGWISWEGAGFIHAHEIEGVGQVDQLQLISSAAISRTRSKQIKTTNPELRFSLSHSHLRRPNTMYDHAIALGLVNGQLVTIAFTEGGTMALWVGVIEMFLSKEQAKIARSRKK